MNFIILLHILLQTTNKTNDNVHTEFDLGKRCCWYKINSKQKFKSDKRKYLY